MKKVLKSAKKHLLPQKKEVRDQSDKSKTGEDQTFQAIDLTKPKHASYRAETPPPKNMAEQLAIRVQQGAIATSSEENLTSPPFDKKKKPGFNDETIRQAMKKWNDIQCDVDDLKATKVYSRLSEEICGPFEEQAKIFEDLHLGVLDGTVRLAPLQEQTGEIIQGPNELGEAIKSFDTLNTMKEIVEFEQKIYNLIGMTSIELSGNKLDFLSQLISIDNKIGHTTSQVGWNKVIEAVTEVLKKPDIKDSYFIFKAIEHHGDASTATGLAKMLTNEQICNTHGDNIINTIRRLTWKHPHIDTSIAKDIIETLPNDGIDYYKRFKAGMLLPLLNNRSIEPRLHEIRNNTQTSQETQEIIDKIFNEWQKPTYNQRPN